MQTKPGIKLDVADEIREDPRLAHLVRQAADFLLEEVGESADAITARWSAGTDETGRPLIVLEVSDQFDSATTRFAPHELDDERHVRWRLTRLWGDLLQNRSHRQLRRLHELIHEIQGD